MKLTIRLQQHGKKNHPYWWIVVAPQHKNIFGLHTEHIGFWSPRHNVNIKRQVILNTPRLMYWLANGAVPTPKVHSFLNMFGLFPKQWQYVKSAEERAQMLKNQKPDQQLTPKQKKLRARSKRRQEQTELKPYNYHRFESMAMFPDKQRQRILAKQHADEFENSVIRDFLHQNDFEKYDRLAELSNKKQDHGKSTILQIQQIKQKLLKQRSQLAMLQAQHSTSNFLKKSKVVQAINNLLKRLNQLQTFQYTRRQHEIPQNENQYITQEYLQQKLKYELVLKKMDKSREELEKLSDLCQPVSLSEIIDKLKETRRKQLENKTQQTNQEDNQQQTKSQNQIDFKNSTEEQLENFAKIIYAQSCSVLSPITRLQLLTLTSHNQQIENIYSPPNEWDDDDAEKTAINGTFKQFLDLTLRQDAFLPTTRPVHPAPDLKSYIPQQHYEPIDVNKLEVMMINSLQPQQQLEKYKKKRNFEGSSAERKKADQRKRMERLRINTQN